MSDRYCLRFELLPCHVGIVGKILESCSHWGWVPEDGIWWDSADLYNGISEHPHIQEFAIDEANYGGMDEFEKIAKAGIPFTGTHYGTSEYGPETFACYNKKLLYVNADRNGNAMLMPVFGQEPDDVAIDDRDLKHIIDYRRLDHKFSQLRDNVWGIIDNLNNAREEHMGQYHIQYHIIVNKTKKQFLDPMMFNEGMKLMEFMGDGYGVMAGLAVLLSEDNGNGGGDLSTENPIVGTWAGDEIIITGDYGDPVTRERGNLYDISFSEYDDVSLKVIDAMTDDHYVMKSFLKEINDGVVFNKDLAEFIKAKAVKLRLLNK